ncbi:MAG: hypothetical protein MJY89_06460 [Bacteroidales bacterium]|nr:hypothetical protein [Bacteroidales bacterium]
MYGREELEPYHTHINCSFFKSYLADEADKVMNAMENRIKELEEKLNDKEQCCKWCSNDARIAGLHKRIAELESQLPKWISVKDRLPTEDGALQ